MCTCHQENNGRDRDNPDALKRAGQNRKVPHPLVLGGINSLQCGMYPVKVCRLGDGGQAKGVEAPHKRVHAP
jgi:hypothetical protein